MTSIGWSPIVDEIDDIVDDADVELYRLSPSLVLVLEKTSLKIPFRICLSKMLYFVPHNDGTKPRHFSWITKLQTEYKTTNIERILFNNSFLLTAAFENNIRQFRSTMITMIEQLIQSAFYRFETMWNFVSFNAISIQQTRRL